MKQIARAHRFLLYAAAMIAVIGIPVAAQADSQGPLSGSLPDESNSPDQVDWTSIESILASDDVRASVTLASDEISERIVPYAFGFSIPSSATIDGIEVNIERRGVGVSGTPETRIFLRKNDNTSYAKVDTSAWPASDSVLTFGGPSDLWGTAWTPADINGDIFGFRPQIQVRTRATDSGTFEIDHVTITVYFTPAPAAVPVLPPIGLLLLTLALMTGGCWVPSRKARQ